MILLLYTRPRYGLGKDKKDIAETHLSPAN